MVRVDRHMKPWQLRSLGYHRPHAHILVMGCLLTRQPHPMGYHSKGRGIYGIHIWQSTPQVEVHSLVVTHCKLFLASSQPRGKPPDFIMNPLPRRQKGGKADVCTVGKTYGTHQGNMGVNSTCPYTSIHPGTTITPSEGGLLYKLQ